MENRREALVKNQYGIINTDDCRKHFTKIGLSYTNVKEDDIQALYMKCIKFVKAANDFGSMSTSTMRMSKKVITKCRSNGSIISAFLFINSHYFMQREAISFNQDGFIGFAGWADSGNTQPFIDAFIEWCDWLKAEE